jgi:predicted ATPase
MHGSGIDGPGAPGAARTTAVAASSSRTTNHPTDLIELSPPQGTLPWFDSMLFKPIRVKLPLTLQPHAHSAVSRFTSPLQLM